MKLYVFVNQTPFYIDSRSTICLHDKMLKFIKKQKKQVTLSYHTGHATIDNALITGDNNVFYFQTMILFRKYFNCYQSQKL